MKTVKKPIKKAQTGTKIADSTAWKNRTFSTLNQQGLVNKRNELKRMLGPDTKSSGTNPERTVISQKVGMLDREIMRRANKKTKELKSGGKMKKSKSC